MADRVVIVPYNPEWSALFSSLGCALRRALGDTALRIDHIGSTSIPGLDAKPIIDIQISVTSFEPLDAFRLPIESLGYAWRENNHDLTKRYFREKPGERRTHIHVRKTGSFSQQFPLLFRDYMRLHEDDCRCYADLKYRLAEQYGDERLEYVYAKDPFIWEIMRKADKWSQSIGWQPGPSDE